jgi:hypothetical protein
MPFEYETADGYHGIGLTLDVSSHGIRARLGQKIWPGTAIRLSLAWPIPRDGNVPLQLRVEGRVIRNEQDATVIVFKTRYTFVTKNVLERNTTPPRS